MTHFQETTEKSLSWLACRVALPHPPLSLPRDLLEVSLQIPRLTRCIALYLLYSDPQGWCCAVLLFPSSVSLLECHMNCHPVGVSAPPQILFFLPLSFLLRWFLISLPEGLPEHDTVCAGASQSMLTDWMAGKTWFGRLQTKQALGERNFESNSKDKEQWRVPRMMGGSKIIFN